MNRLIEVCRTVADHPVSWVVIGALVAVALYGVLHMRYCPHVRGTATVSDGEAAARLASPWIAGPGYALVLLAGIALMLTAFGMIAMGTRPVVSFVTLSLGIAVVQGAPVWLRLREAYDRVVAAGAEGPEAVAFARERLVGMHYAGIATVLAVAAMLALALLVF